LIFEGVLGVSMGIENCVIEIESKITDVPTTFEEAKLLGENYISKKLNAIIITTDNHGKDTIWMWDSKYKWVPQH